MNTKINTLLQVQKEQPTLKKVVPFTRPLDVKIIHTPVRTIQTENNAIRANELLLSLRMRLTELPSIGTK